MLEAQIEDRLRQWEIYEAQRSAGIGPNPNDASTPEGALCWLVDEAMQITVDFATDFDPDALAAYARAEATDTPLPDDVIEAAAERSAGLDREARQTLGAAGDAVRPTIGRLADPVLADFGSALVTEIDRLAASQDPGWVLSFETLETDEVTAKAFGALYEQGICQLRQIETPEPPDRAAAN